MRNISGNTLDRALENEIRRLKKQVKALKTNQLSVIVIPLLTSDPSSPIENQIWVNDTSHTLKIRINGVTKTATLT